MSAEAILQTQTNFQAILSKPESRRNQRFSGFFHFFIFSRAREKGERGQREGGGDYYERMNILKEYIFLLRIIHFLV